MGTALDEGVSEETVEDLAAQEPEEISPMQLPLEGFVPSISATPGGDRPTTASITIRGGKLAVTGQFSKGDVIELYVRAKIAEVHFVDTVDNFGEVTGTERKHIAKPIGVRRFAGRDDSEE